MNNLAEVLSLILPYYGSIVTIPNPNTTGFDYTGDYLLIEQVFIDKCSVNELLFVILHEIGHKELGHLGDYTGSSKHDQEYEADLFALHDLRCLFRIDNTDIVVYNVFGYITKDNEWDTCTIHHPSSNKRLSRLNRR